MCVYLCVYLSGPMYTLTTWLLALDFLGSIGAGWTYLAYSTARWGMDLQDWLTITCVYMEHLSALGNYL